MNRGDRREPIFADDKDRVRFLKTLGEVAAAGAASMLEIMHQFAKKKNPAALAQEPSAAAGGGGTR